MAISTVATKDARPAKTNGQNDDWRFEGTEAGRSVSEALYWEKYYEHPYHSYEWNNGFLELKAMPDQQQISMYGWFLELLRHYLRTRPIANLLFLEIGFRLELPDKVAIRKPDLFVVRNDNPNKLADTDRTYHGICDLAVEALSDSDKAEIERDTVVKKAEYQGVGVREYYILDAHGPYMAFYRLNQIGIYVPIAPDASGVIQSTVLPQFQFRVADLYRQPSPIVMANDPVYQAFVLPEYQAEKARAEAEKARAEAEKARAERLAARLRKLGLDAE